MNSSSYITVFLSTVNEMSCWRLIILRNFRFTRLFRQLEMTFYHIKQRMFFLRAEKRSSVKPWKLKTESTAEATWHVWTLFTLTTTLNCFTCLHSVSWSQRSQKSSLNPPVTLLKFTRNVYRLMSPYSCWNNNGVQGCVLFCDPLLEIQNRTD